MALPPGTVPILGPVIFTAAARPTPTQQLQETNVALLEEGTWYEVVDDPDIPGGFIWVPFAKELPIGTGTRTQLTWEEPQQAWVATAPFDAVRGYPYFVLTRNPDNDELKAALDFYLENPPGERSNQEIQAGQPFTVDGGIRYVGQITEGTDSHRINDVWPEGEHAPTWWVVANTFNDRAEAYWITYFTRNEYVPNVQVAWFDGAAPLEADFVDLGAVNQGELITFPVVGADARFAVWADGGLTGLGSIKNELGVNDWTLFFAFDRVSARITVTPFVLNGVDGHYFITTDPLAAAIYSGAMRSFAWYPAHVLSESDQPHPVVVNSLIRVNGILHDVAREALVGERPDNQVDRNDGTSPWAHLNLGYSPIAATGASTELVTMTSRRGLRFSPPAMFFGWTDEKGSSGTFDVDFSALARSQTLQGLIPRHTSDRGRLVVWITETALEGHNCFVLDIGTDPLYRCNGVPYNSPDGHPGLLWVASGKIPTSGRTHQLLTVTPATHIEEEDDAGDV